MSSNVTTFFHTATDDNPFKLTIKDHWFKDCNIHIATQNAKYGDKNRQDASATTNDVLSFEDVNLNDLFFKNAGAGANTTIYFVGVEMLPAEKARLGVI